MTKLYEANNHILIHAEYLNPAEHAHKAAHIIISLHDEMKITINGNEFIGRGVLIPSGALHRIDTFGKPVLVFLYDSTTNVAVDICDVEIVSDLVCNKIVNFYFECEKTILKDDYSKFENFVLEQLNLNPSTWYVKDDRVISAMQYIHSNISKKLTCYEVADYVHLSEGRFSHLFKNQVGMTFASYVIYQRIMYVYTGIINGKSITDAAIEAGFSSSSHFADVNRRVFGLSASAVMDNLHFIKVQ